MSEFRMAIDVVLKDSPLPHNLVCDDIKLVTTDAKDSFAVGERPVASFPHDGSVRANAGRRSREKEAQVNSVFGFQHRKTRVRRRSFRSRYAELV